MLSVSERGNGGRNDSTDRLNTSMLLPALLGVETSHITARRLRKPQLEGWHGPRRKTGKALLFLPQHRVLVGGKGGSDGSTQAMMGKVTVGHGEARSGLLLER